MRVSRPSTCSRSRDCDSPTTVVLSRSFAGVARLAIALHVEGGRDDLALLLRQRLHLAAAAATAATATAAALDCAWRKSFLNGRMRRK